MSGRETQQFRLGFVCEIVLGHGTFYDHVVRVAAADPDLTLLPKQVPFEATRRLDRIPPFTNWTVRASVKARRAIAEVGPVDAWLINSQTASLGSFRTMRRVPTIISSDATPANYDELAGAYGHRVSAGRAELAKRRLLSRAYRSAAGVLAWTPWVRDSLIRDYDVPAERITVLSPGLAVGAAPADRRGRTGPVEILFVGADFARKGGPELLDAVRRLRARGADVALHLVTRTDVAPEPGVTVHRDLSAGDPRLRSRYAAADVFVLPTKGDSYGWVLLEAMEAALPVVTCPVGGVPGIVHDGRTGLLVPPGDLPALSSALERLVGDENLRLQLGSAGRAVVETEHDAARNVAQLLGVARSLAGRVPLPTIAAPPAPRLDAA
jgi:glycosyltransferase involved in cell wall biosynthesis